MTAAARPFVLAAFAAGCSSSPPPDARITCEQFFDHVGVVTGAKTPRPYSSAEMALCEAKTQEQLRCILAARDTDGLGLCEITDSTRRAIATQVWPPIKRMWAGSADLMAVLEATPGCALFSIDPLADIDERLVSVSFVLRDATTTGDARRISATLRRMKDDWVCEATAPVDQCELLRTTCQPSAR